MGGLSCAKEVIDHRNRMLAVVDCMKATILLHPENPPTQDEADAFKAAAEAVAKLAGKIEARVGEGGY